MKLIKALGVALVVVGSSLALPALADPDIEGGIQDGLCPDPNGPTDGFVTVLGRTVVVPVGTPITEGKDPVDCDRLAEGDRVKISCTDETCATAASIKWDPNSAESAIGIVPCGANPLGFRLKNMACLVDANTEVKQDNKKNFLGLPVTKPPTQPTVADLYAFLCSPTTVWGTTPGTLEVKCTGYNAGPGKIGATKVELKK
jgi:hypothetical protein